MQIHRLEKTYSARTLHDYAHEEFVQNIGSLTYYGFQVYPEFRIIHPIEKQIMHLYYQNVNDAFHGICEGFHTGNFTHSLPLAPRHPEKFTRLDTPPISRTPTRYGEVLVIEEPVVITYAKPTQRVLFNKYRDANPFFHLFEALWTLAGRDDIAPLMHFNSKVADFSDDGQRWWGAYGRRWQVGRMENQLKTAVDILKADRTCRRVVLQQWMPYDLKRVRELPVCKDVPCNTEVMFLPRRTMTSRGVPVNVNPVRHTDGTVEQAEIHEYLDMTVINRSNDMIWGALGSNYVTFSMLHEYIALAAGYEIGVYNQFTNNLHVYVTPQPEVVPEGHPHMLWSGKWEPEKLIADETTALYQNWEPTPLFLSGHQEWFTKSSWYSLGAERFDMDLHQLFSGNLTKYVGFDWMTTFFNSIVSPMLLAWNAHKGRDYDSALVFAADIEAPDWQIACRNWLLARREKHEGKAARS